MHWAVALLCLVLAVLVGAGCLSARAKPPERPSPATTRKVSAASEDRRLAALVTRKILTDQGVRAANIDVESRKGTVVLRGPVSTQAQADRLVELARKVRGVSNVESRLYLE